MRIVVNITAFTDTQTRSGTNSSNTSAIESYDEEAENVRFLAVFVFCDTNKKATFQSLAEYEQYFNNSRFSDFKIMCWGEGGAQQTLNAHRVVLAARSPFFNAMLEPHTKESKEGCVEIKDCDYEALVELITFLYTGQAPNLRTHALEVLAVADRFQVEVLKERAAAILHTQMNVNRHC